MRKTPYRILVATLFAAGAAVISAPASAQAVDEAAAKALFKRNDCGKCHHPTRDKKGPSLQKQAKKLNEKPSEAMDRIIKNLTTGPKVKLLDDQKEEEHKIIDTKDEKQIKNLGAWLLKQ
jgi:cytochrome c